MSLYKPIYSISTQLVEALTNEFALPLPSRAQTVLFFRLKRRTDHFETRNTQTHTHSCDCLITQDFSISHTKCLSLPQSVSVNVNLCPNTHGKTTPATWHWNPVCRLTYCQGNTVTHQTDNPLALCQAYIRLVFVTVVKIVSIYSNIYIVIVTYSNCTG